MAAKAYPLISAKAVIRKIQRDFKPNYESWIGDSLEWSYEAVLRIGTNTALQLQTKPLIVKDFKADLPCNFEDLEGVYLNGHRLAKTLDADMMADRLPEQQLNRSGYGIESYQPRQNQLYFSFKENMKENDLMIKFRGIAMDEEGYPLIPYIPIYMTAIVWYNISMMLLGGWELKGYNSETAEDKFEGYARRAKNSIDFWTPDDAERMEKWWVIPIDRRGFSSSAIFDYNSRNIR